MMLEHNYKGWIPNGLVTVRASLGPCDMHTASGQAVWFDHPQHTEIVLDDIRAGLTNQCRYNGQFVVSILAHSVLVADILSPLSHPQLHAQAVLHDADEAYLGDRNTRAKDARFAYQESAWSEHILSSLGIMAPDAAARRWIKYADRAALLSEMIITGHPSANWSELDWEPYGGKPVVTPRYVDRANTLISTDSNTLWAMFEGFIFNARQ